MDADLQDPPEVVLEMVAKWREGFDVVYGKRRSREGETFFKLLTAKWFYRLFAAMIPIEVPLDTGDFRLMSRRVVLALRELRETHRFVRGMVAWIGFKQTAVLYDRPGRFAGETKYPLRKMLRFAIDGITSFSVLPLRFATYLGMFISLAERRHRRLGRRRCSSSFARRSRAGRRRSCSCRSSRRCSSS